jgi:hypothetical protein
MAQTQNTPPARMAAKTTADEPQSEVTTRMLDACVGRDGQALLAALEAGADVYGYQQKELHYGKTGMHLCALMGFVEGMVLLRSYGLSIDTPEKERGNTALHIAPGSNNEKIYRLLLDMGASLDAENNLGYTAAEVVLPSEAEAKQPLDANQSRNPKIARIIEHYRALPYRASLDGLTLQEAFAADENGFSLMDNPQMLLRVADIAKALDASGTPLTLEALQQPAADGKPYLEKLMVCNRLADTVAALNRHGEQLQQEALLDKDGKPTPLANKAVEWRQVPALFTTANWRDNASGLAQTLTNMPKEMRAQIRNEYQLKAEVRQEHKGMGR